MFKKLFILLTFIGLAVTMVFTVPKVSAFSVTEGYPMLLTEMVTTTTETTTAEPTTTITWEGLPEWDWWLNDKIEGLGFSSLVKTLLMVIILVAISVIIAMLGVPYIIVLMVAVTLAVMFVILGWLSPWVMILFAIGFILLLFISLNKRSD